MESCGCGILSNLSRQLVWVKWVELSLDVLLDQPLKTLEHLIDGVSWAGWEVSKLLTEDFCGRGIITADFRQGGMVGAFRDRLKIVKVFVKKGQHFSTLKILQRIF